MSVASGISNLRKLYLALTVLGALGPAAYFTQWLARNDWQWTGLLDAWGANLATKGAALDLLIAGVTLTLWIIAETRVRRNWSALWAIPATLLVGVSFGLPLYLFLRTRPL